jgi:hypothetical protein
MARNKYLLLADDSEPEYEADIAAQVVRLREILSLMAPESGTSALGGMRRLPSDVPLKARIRALTRPRAKAATFSRS